MMECPYCEKELRYDDYWGRVASHQDGQVFGDIYQCDNQECVMYQEYFHVHKSHPDDIHEGYPC